MRIFIFILIPFFLACNKLEIQPDKEETVITNNQKLEFSQITTLEVDTTSLLNVVKFIAETNAEESRIFRAGFFYSTQPEILYDNSLSFDQLQELADKEVIQMRFIDFDLLDRNPIEYEYEFSLSEVDSTYFFRSFAFFKEEFKGNFEERIYLENVKNQSSITLRGGWFKQPFLGSLFERIAAFSFFNPNTKSVTVGGGCPDEIYCLSSSKPFPFLDFSINTENALLDILAKPALENESTFADDINNRANAIGFMLEDSIYVGTGEKDNQEVLKSFYAYHPSTPKQPQFITTPSNLLARTSAVGFTINGVAYIGLGNNNEIDYYTGLGAVFQDFWRFDPKQPEGQKWKELTLRFDGASENDWLPRRSAIAFTVRDEFAVIGNGFDDYGGNLSDYWKFEPILGTDTIKLSPMGTIDTNIAEGVGFELSGELYVGLGAATTSFFKYQNKNWVEVEPLPSKLPISKGQSFTLGNRGYLFSGVKEGGEISLDLWTYIPE